MCSMDSSSWHPIEAKTGVTKAIFPEPFLIALYRAQAPYRGCAHGCTYCDGRAEKYYVEGDFEKDISVRENLPSLVAADITGGIADREYGAICMGSGVTDVYQGLEKKLELTRRTLEALIPARLPLVILTKNDLVLRDFDLLSQFPRVLILVTVTTVDEATAKIIEPNASRPAARLAVVKKAKEAGFFSGILSMPLCPGISDTDENVTALLSAAQDAGADFVYPGGLTLRPGRQKDLFLSVIDAHCPHLNELYRDVYRENRQSGMPLMSYTSPLMRDWNTRLERISMSQMIPHRIYREVLSPPDSLFVLLCHMQSLYAIKGVDTRPLKRATSLYGAWLKENRSALRRKRISPLASDPFPITRILTEKLTAICLVKGGFATLCGNAKLESLVRAIVIDKKYFDYPSLSAVL